MSAVATTHSEAVLKATLDERALLTRKTEAIMEAIAAREDQVPTDIENETLAEYREQIERCDTRADQLSKDIEQTRKSLENSKRINRMLVDAKGNFDVDDDGIVYRDFYTYARDFVLTRDNVSGVAKLAKQYASGSEVQAMRERLENLKRTPANTLSSNVGGLQPPQFIDQIFQVINKSRALVDSATRTTLERGSLTYPKVSQRPVVAVQDTEKTEAGNQGMVVDLETSTASTYLGGGDLSWQAINWSTPDALQLWFDLAAADYALKTEQDAATVLTDSAYTHHISSQVGSSATFAQIMTGVGAGYSAVFANSGRTADTVYIAPDLFGYFLGLTSNAFTQFATVSGSNLGPLNVVISRGLDAGTMIVGDSDALLVAETAGAPVELRVVEPAIGGVEVGIIGAFEAVVVDDGAFALVTTAS